MPFHVMKWLGGEFPGYFTYHGYLCYNGYLGYHCYLLNLQSPSHNSHITGVIPKGQRSNCGDMLELLCYVYIP
jgi:hypothetical protein